MTLINLTNIFVQPLSAALPKSQVNFKGAEVNLFESGTQTHESDKFTTNPFGAVFTSKAKIEQLAKSNPRIMAILKENNLPLNVNMDVLEDMRWHIILQQQE